MKKIRIFLTLGLVMFLIWGLYLPKYPKPPLPNFEPHHMGALPSISAELTRGDALLLDQVLTHPPINMESLTAPLSKQDQVDAPEAGLVVPHHLVAAGSILKAYQVMQGFEPTAVVILSPAHQSPVNDSVVSCTLPIKVVDVTHALHPAVQNLIQGGHIVAENSRFASEHGIYHQLPFIDKVFGPVKIIPLALARNMTLRDLEALKLALDQELKDERVLYVASVDFSHDLPASVANQKDQTTQGWISKRQYDALLAASNDYLDAPSCIAYMMLKFDQMTLLWHSNSAEVSGYGFNAPGTSYHIYACHNKE